MKNACCSCLQTGDQVRPMIPIEINSYQQFVKEVNIISDYHVCLFCGHLIKKFGKFLIQCQEANRILNSFINKDTKLQDLSPLHLTYNLTVTPPQTLDVVDQDEVKDQLFEDDTGFDDDDVPLVMFKKEDTRKIKKRKKKKVKNGILDADENDDNTNRLLNTEDYIKTDEALAQISHGNSAKCKRKPKKELREGFSSRMVQETEEYVVIKLTKEQVRSELAARAQSAEYLRARYKCAACAKGFNFEDVLRAHAEKHSAENGPHQCDICTQYCPSVVSLRGHMKSHTTRYKCKVCGCERQARQHLLEHHATAHTRGALRYSCRQCDFATTKRTSMQRHVKSHRPEQRHACHQCGKLFKSLETLRVHTVRHDKSRRLSCESCGRVFIYPSLLHRHVQAVHVRKDYYCVECDREFSSRENLRLHFKKAKKHRDASTYQLECQHCPERFPTAAALAAHAHVTSRAPRARGRPGGAGDAHKTVLAPPQEKLEDALIPEVNQPTLLESI